MKQYDCPSNIGAGLFTDEGQPVQINFPNGDRLEAEIRALTQTLVIELQNKGIKFDKYKGLADAALHMKKIVGSLVVEGTYYPAKGEPFAFDDDKLGRVLSHKGLTEKLIEIARDLAEEIVEEDEENSDS